MFVSLFVLCVLMYVCVDVDSFSTAIADKSAEVLQDIDKAKNVAKEAKGEEEKGEGDSGNGTEAKKKGKGNLFK